jgi:tripartite ATP-independent transporter DctP family solute receptor
VSFSFIIGASPWARRSRTLPATHNNSASYPKERTMHKLFAALTLAAGMLAGPAHSQIVTKLSGIQPLDHPSSYAEKFFAEQVSVLTNGTVKVETYHNTQLGDAVANVQSVRNGTIGFTVVSASNLNQVVPGMDMFSLPYIFKNEAHFWWFLAQPEAESFVKQLEDKGIKKLAYIDSGSRNLFTQKPVRAPADMKGQKIRVMASPVMVKTMESLGATGVPVAWAELYTALQTGVVDGAENNHPSVVAKKFYEVSKYYTLDEHMRIPDLLVVSKKFFDSLNPQQQAAVMQAGQLTQAYMRGAWKISELKDLAELKAKFTQIIEPNKQPFMESVKPLVTSEAKRLDVEKTVAFILESGKKF